MPKYYAPTEIVSLSFQQLAGTVSNYLLHLIDDANKQMERWKGLEGAVGIHQGYIIAQVKYYKHVIGFLKAHSVNTVKWGRNLHTLSKSLEDAKKGLVNGD